MSFCLLYYISCQTSINDSATEILERPNDWLEEQAEEPSQSEQIDKDGDGQAAIEDGGDDCDRENLKLSAFTVRALLGPQLLGRVIQLVGPMASVPEIFVTAAHQMSFMTAALVRKMCNEIVP